MSLVRILFCEEVIRGLFGTTCPSKYFFIVATPELIQSKVGSSTGTREALGISRWPCWMKKSKNIRRTWALLSFFNSFISLVLSWLETTKSTACNRDADSAVPLCLQTMDFACRFKAIIYKIQLGSNLTGLTPLFTTRGSLVPNTW